jgi:DNA-directed RNA polymerase subunit N (RpoN/RPB10)
MEGKVERTQGTKKSSTLQVPKVRMVTARSKDPMMYSGTTELPHIRCYSCGKVIGHLNERYNEMLSQNMTPVEIFEKLGVKRMCCRLRIANPAVIATAEYIEQSDVSLDAYEAKEAKEKIIEEAEDLIRNDLLRKEEERQKDLSKVSKLQNRMKALMGKKEAKKSEQPPKRINVAHYYAT